MKITKEFNFEAAHKLLGHDGPCKELHGHSYLLQVTVEGPVDKNGFVIDFGELKSIVEKNVISEVDHAYLNKIIMQPTAENIVMWIWQRLADAKLPVCEIKLWETHDSFVTYIGES